MTNQPGIDFTLRVVLHQENSTIPIYIMFDKFKVQSESNGYMLDHSLRNYRHSVKNSYVSNYFYTGKKFSTMDRNNGGRSQSSSSYMYRNCVNLSALKTSGGGWWFNGYPHCYSWLSCNNRYSYDTSCGYVNLNAKIPYYSGISGVPTNITTVHMKIRPTDVKNY